MKKDKNNMISIVTDTYIPFRLIDRDSLNFAIKTTNGEIVVPRPDWSLEKKSKRGKLKLVFKNGKVNRKLFKSIKVLAKKIKKEIANYK